MSSQQKLATWGGGGKNVLHVGLFAVLLWQNSFLLVYRTLHIRNAHLEQQQHIRLKIVTDYRLITRISWVADGHSAHLQVTYQGIP
jgi:hypothetical protein